MLLRFRKKFIGDLDFQKAVFAVAIPLMLQSLITSSVALVDNLMVGQLGDSVIGAVASVNRFYMVANFGINGIAAAACIFLAQYMGARNKGKMQESFRFTILSSVLMMVPFFLIAMFAPSMVLRFFTSEAELIAIGSSYLRIVGISFLPAALSIALYSSIRSIGETKLPLFISVMTVFTNAVLNYLLIFGTLGFPKMGADGAALATLLARLLEVVVLLVVVKVYDFDFKTKLHELFHIEWRLVKAIMYKAFPLAANEVLWAGGMATLLKIYGTRGV
ncbi:MAG: MATE family efflux transporter, partial [Erysipelotrichaceae bacterium]